MHHDSLQYILSLCFIAVKLFGKHAKGNVSPGNAIDNLLINTIVCLNLAKVLEGGKINNLYNSKTPAPPPWILNGGPLSISILLKTTCIRENYSSQLRHKYQRRSPLIYRYILVDRWSQCQVDPVNFKITAVSV